MTPTRRPGCHSPTCPQPDCEALKRTIEALPPNAGGRIQFDKWCRRPAEDHAKHESRAALARVEG